MPESPIRKLAPLAAAAKKRGTKVYHLMWIYKVRWTQPDDDYETKGESISFKKPSITGKIAPLTESALLLFPSAHVACEAVAALKPTGAAVAAEFFDRRAMRAVEKDFPELAGLPEEAGALLVKIEAETPEELSGRRAKIVAALAPFPTAAPVAFTSDPAVVSRWWAMQRSKASMSISWPAFSQISRVRSMGNP